MTKSNSKIAFPKSKGARRQQKFFTEKKMKLKVEFEGMDKVLIQTSRKPKSFWQEKIKPALQH